jgi:flagellar basal-body rod protein FlgG
VVDGAFYIGAIGMDAQQRALDVTANNIANINTVGFKRSVVRFSELVAPSRVREGVTGVERLAASNLAGVAVGGTTRVWTQGDLSQTGQTLDLAIDGDGFIELMGTGGRSLLWRGGSLKINADGYLATADGTVLHGLVAVPQSATQLTIASDGTVSALASGESQATQLGKLDLVMVKDPSALNGIGGGYYEVPDPSETFIAQAGEEGAGRFVQGSLETSNVQLTDEMMSLLMLQRAYAANAQVVQAGDQLLSIANGLRR